VTATIVEIKSLPEANKFRELKREFVLIPEFDGLGTAGLFGG
jgi:hypothetical protein